jgi:hypothetical protein
MVTVLCAHANILVELSVLIGVFLLLLNCCCLADYGLMGLSVVLSLQYFATRK